MKANFETGLKICSHCRRELPISEFSKDKSKSDGLNSRCKECEADYRKSESGKSVAKKARKKYYQTEKGKACEKRQIIKRSKDDEWKEIARLRSKEYYKEHKQPPKRISKNIIINDKGEQSLICSKCKRELPIENFYKDKFQICGYDQWCKDCRREYRKIRCQTEEYRKYNRIKQAEIRQSKDYRKKVNEYVNNRFKIDINFKFSHHIRSRIRRVLKGEIKSGHSLELLGCSIDELKVHLEQQFEPGMTWNNYGEWQIDHIIPCAKFDFSNPIHQRICFNYRNLQPLWAEENNKKKDNLPNGWEELLDIIRESLGIEEVVDLK